MMGRWAAQIDAQIPGLAGQPPTSHIELGRAIEARRTERLSG